MPAISADGYGGAMVRRRISCAGAVPVPAGAILSREELARDAGHQPARAGRQSHHRTMAVASAW